MNMNKKYSGFTLVEMLIVMGILIILMAIGIAAGRFAIQRANVVAHQNAADAIFTAMQAYYTDNRQYPNPNTFIFGDSMQPDGDLHAYLIEGEFNGGIDATYYYWTDGLRQEALVCVSLGGIDDEPANRGYYCTGNGFGNLDITEKSIEPGHEAFPTRFPVTQPWRDGRWGSSNNIAI
jgi:type II secretory pathway pseudopilin PulG